MKLLIAAGGTMGSVNPLLAIYEESMRQGRNWEWFWVGTRNGIERSVAREYGIRYEWIPMAKLRRYFSWRTFGEPLVLMIAFFRSLLIIMSVKPDAVLSAGSFVAVPVVWAAWCMRKKILIHQQDVRPGFANMLCAWCADVMTVSLKTSLKDFPRAVWVGNPMRQWLMDATPQRALQKFNLDPELPLLLVIGGSSGSEALNRWTAKHVSALTRGAQLIHVTGKGKGDPSIQAARYMQVEYLSGDLADVLCAADVVVTRAGMSTLTELSYLKKAAIVVPMPDTHQEDNAFAFARERAVKVIRQDQLERTGVTEASALLRSKDKRKALGEHIHGMIKKDAHKKIIELII